MIAWLVFQLTLTSLPESVLPAGPSWRIDWLAHFCMYFGLGWLVARAGMRRGWTPMTLALVWAGIAVFGVLDELHEALFIPGRAAEVMDWAMDASGSWCGLFLAYYLKGKRWAEPILR